MDDLQRALSDIGAIRSQMARQERFRGYGPATVAVTAALALLAAALQAYFLPEASAEPFGFVMLWSVAALLSVAITATEVVARARREHLGMAQEMVAAAAEQLLPAGAAGALLTLVLWRFAPAEVWMLPGLWQIAFSLGIFASCRFLPKPVFAIGVWYLLTGLGCLALAQGDWALSPWTMALPFGIGQALVAIILLVDKRAHDAR